MSSGRVVGLFGYHHWDPCHRRADIGYDLARGLWGQGLGGRQLGHLTSGLQRFRSAAECQDGVGLTTGMLHLVHPLRQARTCWRTTSWMSRRSMAGSTVEGAAPAMGRST